MRSVEVGRVERIKSCPFCDACGKDLDFKCTNTNGRWRVVCLKCEAMGPLGREGGDVLDAAANWSWRAALNTTNENTKGT